MSDEVIENWYQPDQTQDGSGKQEEYTDLAIKTCREIRKVFHQPLRQSTGFVDSIFRMKELSITCPDYSTLSKRLGKLGITCPTYRDADARPDDDLAAIAMDSTGLKRFGRDEWHQEKHKISGKRSWRKLHIAVDDKHYIQGCELTDRFVHDSQAVKGLSDQVAVAVGHCTADAAYDKNTIYDELSNHFPEANIVIPPRKDAVWDSKSHTERNKNILYIKLYGHMQWQRKRNYGQRNYSELAIQRYKRILGNTVQSRELSRQKQEAMIGCGILNKMTSLGMPQSYKV